ncbi:hypothetical protein OUZ56_006036 [Daphnia magna]|uniref:Uncharacterized protein n=1 Tax=Daphnia magna TaxID=35525 RepID=A0ABQ9YUG0_9CRUS|nr:hypothetical protein OUZ56_006036 [Daphnia magna]
MVDKCDQRLSTREGRRSDGHIGQGWLLRIKKGYTYAIDNDINIYRQLEHTVPTKRLEEKVL